MSPLQIQLWKKNLLGKLWSASTEAVNRADKRLGNLLRNELYLVPQNALLWGKTQLEREKYELL